MTSKPKKPLNSPKELTSIAAHLVQKQLTRHEVASLIRSAVTQAINEEIAVLDVCISGILRSPATMRALLKAGLVAGAVPRVDINWDGDGVTYKLEFDVSAGSPTLPPTLQKAFVAAFDANKRRKQLKDELSAVREFRKDELALGLRVLLEQAPWAQGLRDEMNNLVTHFRAHMRKKA